MRVWGFGKAEFDLEMARQDRSIGQRPLRAASAFRQIVNDGGSFDKCQRYAVTYERQFTRVLRTLKEMQLSRPREIPPPDVHGNLANSTWDSDPKI